MAKAAMHYFEPTAQNERLCGAHRMTRADGDRTRVTCTKCLAILARPEYADDFTKSPSVEREAREAREVKMFGCTADELRAAVKDAEQGGTDALMCAASMLSDGARADRAQRRRARETGHQSRESNHLRAARRNAQGGPMIRRSARKCCRDCKRAGRVHACQMCGALRCPHFMKQTKTGYICPPLTNCSQSRLGMALRAVQR